MATASCAHVEAKRANTAIVCVWWEVHCGSGVSTGAASSPSHNVWVPQLWSKTCPAHSNRTGASEPLEGGKGASGATRPGEMAVEGHLLCLEEAPPLAMDLVFPMPLSTLPPGEQESGPMQRLWTRHGALTHTKCPAAGKPELSPQRGQRWMEQPSVRATR